MLIESFESLAFRRCKGNGIALHPKSRAGSDATGYASQIQCDSINYPIQTDTLSSTCDPMGYAWACADPKGYRRLEPGTLSPGSNTIFNKNYFTGRIYLYLSQFYLPTNMTNIIKLFTCLRNSFECGIDSLSLSPDDQCNKYKAIYIIKKNV